MDSQRSNRNLHLAFIAGFVLLASIPLLCFAPRQTVSEDENRQLAPPPAPFADGKPNPRFFSDADAYLSDHFGMRSRLVALDEMIRRVLFRDPQSGKGFIWGKNGWTFLVLDNLLADFFKYNLVEESTLEKMEHRLSETVTWCHENGMAVLFVIGPNKHSVYPEYYPFPRPDGPTFGDQVAGVFARAGIPLVFPRNELLRCKECSSHPLYYETDSHWNLEGAWVAAERIEDELKRLFPHVAFPEIAYDFHVVDRPAPEDSQGSLPLDWRTCTVLSATPATPSNGRGYIYLENEGLFGRLHTRGDNPALPRALFFRDSFCVALEPFLSPLFSEAEYLWHHFTDEDKEHVLEFKPDVVVFQTVERSSLTIAGPLDGE